MGRLAAQVNLMACALAPTSLFMVLCDRGPLTMERLDAPDHDADLKIQLTVGSMGGDQLTAGCYGIQSSPVTETVLALCLTDECLSGK